MLREALTISLRGIPVHDTAKTGVLCPRLCHDLSQRVGCDISGSSGSRGCRDAKEDLDVFIGCLGACPGVPLVEVPCLLGSEVSTKMRRVGKESNVGIIVVLHATVIVI
jgi:hypothetical protein